MDYARKIGKSDKPQIWKREVPMGVTVSDDLISKDEPISEDRRLVNWKTWLANRRKQYKHIENYTGRDQNDQVLNSSEKVRPLIEMRNLMDRAARHFIPDKYRGSPDFWKIPETLSNRGNPCLPPVSVTHGKKVSNIRPGITYVATPELIQKEKDLKPVKLKEASWKRSSYLKRRKEEVADAIESLVLKEPETEKLVIEGHGMKEKPKEIRVPPITITAPEEEDEYCHDYDHAVILKIQDTEIVLQKSNFKADRDNPAAIDWNIHFDGEVNETIEKTIVLENKGTGSIIYYWRDSSLRGKIVNVDYRVSPFFFNKTKQVIAPGQFAWLKFWFLPRIPGVFTETWRLVTDPTLCPSLLLFRFWGYAEMFDAELSKYYNHRSIDSYLNGCIRQSIIREILNDIMQNIDHSKPPEPSYGSLFLEADVFRSKNPTYYHHHGIVTEFRKIHCSVVDRNAPAWNLSVDQLRETLLGIKETNYRNDVLSRFNDLCKDSLKPSLRGFDKSNKHDTVYCLLSAFANLFEAESEYTKKTCLIKGLSTSMVEREPMISTSISETLVGNNNSRGKHGRKWSNRSQNNQIQDNSGTNAQDVDFRTYREMFFVRIHEALGEAIDRACATIDSFNRLNEGDK
ncbi:hypothetical protein KM043_007022 [Ampulex compressa]|nr:hypothetical protein KM043_007022 [Ampulex compressa]